MMTNKNIVKFIDTPTLLTSITTLKETLSSCHKRLAISESSSDANNASEKVRVCKENKHFKYYIISSPEDTNGKFIPKKNLAVVRRIIQRDYERKLCKFLKKAIPLLEAFIKFFSTENLENAFSALHPGRQALIEPIIPTREQFIKQWLNAPYKQLPFSEGSPEFITASGIRVRSKSEVIIADTLTRLDIPFRYEQPHVISNIQSSHKTPHNASYPSCGTQQTSAHPATRRSVTVHPDFTCLNPRTREEFIWEHFGLMGNADYAHNAILKISQYASSGFILGKNFIATFEDDETPLATKLVQTYAKDFLL